LRRSFRVAKKRRSVGDIANLQLYVQGQLVIPYQQGKNKREQKHYRDTFMDHWSFYFRFGQIFYLVLLMLGLLVQTGFMIFNRLDMHADELYDPYLEQKQEAGEEPN